MKPNYKTYFQPDTIITRITDGLRKMKQNKDLFLDKKSGKCECVIFELAREGPLYLQLEIIIYRFMLLDACKEFRDEEGNYNSQVWDKVIEPFFITLIDQIHQDFDEYLGYGFLFTGFHEITAIFSLSLAVPGYKL